MRPKLLFLTLLAAFLLAPTAVPAEPPAGEEPGADDPQKEEAELKAEVPELMAFHEVIYPLWHQAWPEKDTAMMKELLPQVQEHVKAVRAVELPGILRDKQEAWDRGVAALTATLAAYEEAAADGNDEALMAAVETIHSDFETLVRTVRPVMDELGAYHVELYKIYHRHVHDRDLEGLRASAAILGDQCRKLAAAGVPKWYEGKPELLEAGIADLCQRTEALNTVLDGDDWDHIVEAVESVHSHYQKIEQLFD